MHPLLQILITVWIGLHPSTMLLPHQYSGTGHSCQDRVNELFKHRKPKSYRKMQIECVAVVGNKA